MMCVSHVKFIFSKLYGSTLLRCDFLAKIGVCYLEMPNDLFAEGCSRVPSWGM